MPIGMTASGMATRRRLTDLPLQQLAPTVAITRPIRYLS
jgi:hypothetical protein